MLCFTERTVLDEVATHCSNTHACCSVWLTYFTTAGFPEGLDCTGEQGGGAEAKGGVNPLHREATNSFAGPSFNSRFDCEFW